MKTLTNLFFSIFLFTCISCSTNPLTEKDNHKTVEFPLNTPFQIQLNENSSSQAEWKYISNNKSIILLKGIDIDFIDRKKIVTFNFKTKGEGKETIRIEYSTTSEQLKVFELKVISGTMGRILSD